MKYMSAVLVALLLLVACGSASSAPITEAQLCADLQTFRGSIGALRSASAATAGEIRDSMSKVSTAWDAVRRDVVALRPSELANIEAAYHNLDTALTQMPNTASTADAKTIIGERTAAVDAAWTQLNASVKCG